MCTQNGEWVIISRIKINNKFLKSLQCRLLAIFLLVGIVPGAILLWGMLSSYENHAVSLKTIEAQTQGRMIANKLGGGNALNAKSTEPVSGEIIQLANIIDGRVMIIDGNFKIILDTYKMDENKTIVSEEVVRAFRGEAISYYDEKAHYLEMVLPIHDGAGKEELGMVLISISTDSVNSFYEYLSGRGRLLQIACGIVVLAIAAWFSLALVRPFQRLRRSIEELSDGHAEGDVSFSGYTEIGMLVDAFNRILARMRTLDASRQEFVSNVSHELKTPITSMKVLADSLLVQEEVPVELYKEFMQDIVQEIDREDTIINDLLSLVKMDRSSSDLNISPMNINELLELILKRLRPIAAIRNIELVFESFRPVTAEVDEVKLTLALTNLVENAIKYNQDNGWVHVSLNADHKFFFVKVSDSGIGIPEDSQEHIYERFYRVDKSHSREIGGTGLGLSITRSAVLMHRGAIKVYSKEGEGTTFTVRIPLIFIA